MNFMTDDESGRVAAAYGANYSRLANIKREHDPENMFHLNQNIKPSSASNAVCDDAGDRAVSPRRVRAANVHPGSE